MLKISLLFKKIQTLRVNNSIIFTIKDAKFSGYYFYINLNILRDFQICISVPSIKFCKSYFEKRDSSNKQKKGMVAFSAGFTAKFGLVFVLTFE